MSDAIEQACQKPCPECGGERIKAQGGVGSVVLNPDAKSFFGIPGAALVPIVCLNCGYTVFYAHDASKLKKKS